MIRDFEQIIGDTRFWLRKTSKQTISRKNFANQLGLLRHSFEIFNSPEQCISGYELRSVIGGRCIAGALHVESLGVNGNTDVTELAWHDGYVGVRSMLTGSNRPNMLQDLPGVVLDRVHDQIAVPLNKVLRIIGQ